MPTFAVQIVNHALPEVSIINADAGVPPITYEQIKQSLGTQVYKVDDLYLYSQNTNQLLNVLQFQRYDVNGNQTYSTIATTIDPYAYNSISTFKDLQSYEDNFILNGNSSFSTIILPLTFVEMRFNSKRITNEFGSNLNNFAEIEIAANKPYFFNNYGASIQEIEETNSLIKKTASKSLAANQVSEKIKCSNCSWQWDTADSSKQDQYVCHKCGFDNSGMDNTGMGMGVNVSDSNILQITALLGIAAITVYFYKK